MSRGLCSGHIAAWLQHISDISQLKTRWISEISPTSYVFAFWLNAMQSRIAAALWRLRIQNADCSSIDPRVAHNNDCLHSTRYCSYYCKKAEFIYKCNTVIDSHVENSKNWNCEFSCGAHRHNADVLCNQTVKIMQCDIIQETHQEMRIPERDDLSSLYLCMLIHRSVDIYR